MKDKKIITVGIIGWGFMGKTHTHALRSIALFYPGIDFEVKLGCICTRREDQARQAARDAGFARWCTDWRELIAMDEIDVVSVCTPNELHEEMAVAALKAGKHVYLDKPVAVTGESAARIAQAALQAPGQTRVAFNNRYMPAVMRARQLVDEGRIGRIMHFEARYLHSGSVDPNKAIGWKQQAQGGTLLDMGSHVLDLVTYLMGYPRRALCSTRVLYPQRPNRAGEMEAITAEDHCLMLLEMPDGALGTVEASKIATGSNDDLTLEIRGDRGALKWNSMDPNYLDYYDAAALDAPIGGLRGFTRIETVARYPAPGGSFLPPKNTIGWERGHTHCYFDFLDAVAHDRPAENTIAEGARLQRLMDQLLVSSREGRWVEVEA